jgi:hypothetical protein
MDAGSKPTVSGPRFIFCTSVYKNDEKGGKRMLTTQQYLSHILVVITLFLLVLTATVSQAQSSRSANDYYQRGVERYQKETLTEPLLSSTKLLKSMLMMPPRIPQVTNSAIGKRKV